MLHRRLLHNAHEALCRGNFRRYHRYEVALAAVCSLQQRFHYVCGGCGLSVLQTSARRQQRSGRCFSHQCAVPHTQLLSSENDEDLGTVRLRQLYSVTFTGPTDMLVDALLGNQGLKIICNEPSLPTVDVLVPSYGAGVIQRRPRRIQTRQSMLQDVRPAGRASVKHIHLLDSKNSNRCAMLLPCIGDRLESIRVHGLGQDDAFLQLILDHCPDLMSIELTGLSLTTCLPLTNALNNTHYSLSSIRMREWQVEDEQSLIDLLALLADPRSLAARRLKTFVINDPGSAIGTFKSASAKMLAKVDHRNNGLQYNEAHMTLDLLHEYDVALQKNKQVEQRSPAK